MGSVLGQKKSLEEARQITPLFLPAEFHGQRNLAGYDPRGRRVGENLATEQQHLHAS